MTHVLIISDDPPRANRLRELFAAQDIAPVWYPHPRAYLLDLADRQPAALVVDLLLPLEPKLAVVRKAREQYPDLMLVLIGKRDFLKQEQLFRNDARTLIVDDIEEVPLKAEAVK